MECLTENDNYTNPIMAGNMAAVEDEAPTSVVISQRKLFFPFLVLVGNKKTVEFQQLRNFAHKNCFSVNIPLFSRFSFLDFNSFMSCGLKDEVALLLYLYCSLCIQELNPTKTNQCFVV